MKTALSLDDIHDVIGRACGYALAVYDQTTSHGGQLDRINETRATLSDMIDDERFSDEVAAVIDGLCAGLTTYMQMVLAQEAGLGARPRHPL